MHGNEWRGAYQRLDESSTTSYPATQVPSANNGAGFLPQQWARVDALGNTNAIQADKQHLVQELSIPFRDLRTLDPSLRIPYPIALFVRLKAIIVNFEALRMIITHDEAFVLSVPVPGESLLVGQAAKLQGTFVKHLQQCILGHDARHSTPSDADSGSTKPAFVQHAELPFELRCLEAALETALSVMAGETGALELHTSPLFSRASHKVARGELELLRDSRSVLSKLTNRVTKLKQELETVLGSESEMEMLYLGRRAASQEPAQQPAQPSAHQQQQQQEQQGEEGDAPQPGTGRGRRPSHAASAPPRADQETSEDDAETLPPADNGAEEPQRRHSAEGGQPRRKSHDWKHSVRQVTRMLSTLHTMQSLQQSTLQSDKSTWALANLLDSNLMHCEHLLQRLEVLKDHLLSVEKFINSELDHRRNELVSLDIFVTALMSMFAFVSMIGSIFGMNLTNGWESSHVVFMLATWGSLAGAALIFGSIMWFAWSKHLLLIPDTSSVPRDGD